MRLSIFVAHTAAWLMLPATAWAFPYKVHTRTLDNGCELVVVPMPAQGVVATAVWMDVGSRNEVEPGRTGFAHFFEHLLFSGTEQLSRADRERALLQLGIGDNAWTALDETVYHAVSDTRSLDEWMGIQADMVAHLALTADQVERESGAVYGEYRKTQASPDFHLEQALRGAAYTTHPYGHDTLGYEADIAAMPSAYPYALEFYARWYQPEHARVLLVGDIEPEAGFSLLEKHFGPWESAAVAVPEVPAEPPQEGPRQATVPWDSEIPPHLVLAWRIPAHDPHSDDLAALELAESLLLGPAGRLQNRLIREEALALRVSGGREATVDPGLFTIHVELKPGASREQVEQIIDAELDTLVEGVDPALLERTRSHVKYSTLTRLDDPGTVLYVVGSQLRRGADPDHIGEFGERVAATEAAGLGRAVAKHLGSDNRTTVWLAHEVPDAQ